jgi:pimeloyl-ACP methyl ester carboxylesterase
MAETTKVFVHGNPETSAIWDLLVHELQRGGVAKIVRLSPPGFGAPTPAGWGATVVEYRDWLIGELEKIDGEIDLVAHDWGAGHVFNALAARPNLVRSWAADCVGLMHPDYEWHTNAKEWQTPDVGEKAVAGMVAISESDFVAFFGSLGMTADIAGQVKRGINDEMARCILALYRDAVQPRMAELGKQFIAAAPANGLVIVATNDHFAGPAANMTQIAGQVNAKTATIADAGHWWMCEQPQFAASMLMQHWSSVAN